MRLVGSFLCSLALVLALLGSAHAQSTPQQKALARELYTNGQQLFRRGDFTGAQRAFEEAYRAVPNPVVLLSISECQVRTEQYQRAIESLRTYLTEKPNAPDRTQVEEQIKALEAKPATLVIQTTAGGAQITVDGSDTGSFTPAELSLPAGEHTVAATLEGYERAEQSILLHPGDRETLRIELTALPPPPVASAPVSEAPPVQEDSDRHPTPAFWAATGVAGAGLLTGVVLGSVALKKKSEFDKDPTEKLADKGERLALFADVGFGIAAAAGVTAVVLFLTSGKKSQEKTPDSAPQAWSVNPTLARGHYGVAGNLSF